MSTKNYDDIPAVRRSDLWQLKKSPLHYLYAVTHPSKSTVALEFGTAAHKYILEPEKFADAYAIAPKVDRRTKAGKAEWTAFIDQLGDKEPITEEDYMKIREMNEAVLANPTASALLKTGAHEIPFRWTDPETGELCKCRPDCLTEYNGEKYIVDYKTTTSCENGHFERACRSYGYKLQAAMYTEGVFADTLLQYRFAFVAQEKNPPYAVRVYFCDPGFVEEGLQQFRDLIELYHKCKTTGNWPGYEDKELIGDE